MVAAGVPGTPAKTYLKDPDAKLDYAVDWSTWLGRYDRNKHVVRPDGYHGIDQPGAKQNNDDGDYLARGGTAGNSYDIINNIVTAAGRNDDRTFRVTIKEK